jgi:hypothetical protein
MERAAGVCWRPQLRFHMVPEGRQMQELGSLWEELVHAWLINNRVNLLMLNQLTSEALGVK